ncbi:putative peptidyl-prolyl cis-trans isomerase dodo isoform X1 [Anopheles moucheti]|uniref:putative peptidyl-prolyl cis-trans isomerase dodo isoform X1 n=1 Tax=Anopheles moucheti TaxID=186751 RepID=UPI0022F04BB5|nr:putative peptidyl-prolyl cis-trans isomerase dodo isoform X1 [Anopheles moucheti]
MSDGQETVPEGWEKRTSRSTGMTYYLNVYTKESQWNPPTAPAEPANTNVSVRGRDEPHEVQCAHLLVKHNKSRRPSSWREENITRSKDEALEVLESYRKKIQSNETTLQELAQRYSDCSSAKRGGDLGMFKRGMMQKPFEDAAFALKVGDMSDIVDTDSGVHLILRLK